MWAAYLNRTDIVSMLIEAGTDLNVQNRHGRTALMFALGQHNFGVAELLRDAGADINVVEFSGRTALDFSEPKSSLFHLLHSRGAKHATSAVLQPIRRRLRRMMFADEFEQWGEPLSTTRLVLLYPFGLLFVPAFLSDFSSRLIPLLESPIQFNFQMSPVAVRTILIGFSVLILVDLFQSFPSCLRIFGVLSGLPANYSEKRRNRAADLIAESMTRKLCDLRLIGQLITERTTGLRMVAQKSLSPKLGTTSALSHGASITLTMLIAALYAVILLAVPQVDESQRKLAFLPVVFLLLVFRVAPWPKPLLVTIILCFVAVVLPTALETGGIGSLVRPNFTAFYLAPVAACSIWLILTFERWLRWHRLRAAQTRVDETAAKIGRLLGTNYLAIPDSREKFGVYLRPFVTTNRVPLGRMHIETIIAYSFAPFVRIIALGRPGEHIGAGRIQTSDTDWQDEIQRMLDCCEIIVCIPSARAGTLWELSQLKRRGWLDKTIFIMPRDFELPPNSRPFGRYFSEEWSETVKVASDYGLKFPPFFPKGLLFKLNSDGSLSEYAPFEPDEFILAQAIFKDPSDFHRSELYESDLLDDSLIESSGEADFLSSDIGDRTGGEA